MFSDGGRKTERAYWEGISQAPMKLRLPSRFDASFSNIARLLKEHVKPGSRFLEIGCAPGKTLAWVASVLKAEVFGLDYSQPGIAKCRKLFDALGLNANFYQEDLWNNQLPPAFFDVVMSFNVIEHFDDPRPAVRKHIDLLRPGGVALITVPNYNGIYGPLQLLFDSKNLSMHNLEIMTPCALSSLVDSFETSSIRAYPFGRIAPGLVHFEKRLPHYLTRALVLTINALGLIQPFTIESFAPMLVLEVTKPLLR